MCLRELRRRSRGLSEPRRITPPPPGEDCLSTGDIPCVPARGKREPKADRVSLLGRELFLAIDTG